MEEGWAPPYKLPNSKTSQSVRTCLVKSEEAQGVGYRVARCAFLEGEIGEGRYRLQELMAGKLDGPDFFWHKEGNKDENAFLFLRSIIWL